MEIYSTEEQQAEAIKRFFRENGLALGIGVLLGLGGLFGYKKYTQHQVTSAESASDAYTQLLTGQQAEDFIAKTDEFMAQYADSSYATLAAFVAAKEAIAKADFDAALAKLNWITANSQDEVLKATANTRIARVQLAQQKFDEALVTLSLTYPQAFSAQVEEIKGDVFVAQGEPAKAAVAYQAALDNAGDKPTQLLEIKLNDVRQATTTADAS